MTDTDLSAALDGMRRRARQITDEHAADDCDLDGETCTGHDAELLLAAVDAVLTLADAIAVPHAPARNSYEGGYVDAERQLGKVFREEVARALTGEEAAP
jgi:hypothetical protein